MPVHDSPRKTPMTPQQKVIAAAAVASALGVLASAVNFGYIALHDREHRVMTLNELCGAELSGDPEKDDPLITARNAMGGCR